MEVVIDTSAILAVILDEPERDRLIEMVSKSVLIGPGSIPWEVGNAFSAMIRRNRLSLEAAIEGIEIFKKIQIQFIEPDYAHVMKLCFDNNTYAYDAYFLDCAIRFKAPLLTLDKNLKSIAQMANIVVWEA